MDVAGEEPLELAAYGMLDTCLEPQASRPQIGLLLTPVRHRALPWTGHYLDVSSTPELEALAKWMPEAASLGYWHFFSSMLARRTVRIV